MTGHGVAKGMPVIEVKVDGSASGGFHGATGYAAESSMPTGLAPHEGRGDAADRQGQTVTYEHAFDLALTWSPQP
jgi:hypothetical protein